MQQTTINFSKRVPRGLVFEDSPFIHSARILALSVSLLLGLTACSQNPDPGSLENTTSESEPVPSPIESVPITSIVSTSSPVSIQKFEIEPPINIEFCYDMSLPICMSASNRDNQLALGYHYPPLEGIPSSWNRNVTFWQSLTEKERNDYLSTALWNFVARLGISGGVQNSTYETISSEYQYALSNTDWLVKNLKAGVDVVSLLESIRTDERKLGSQEWLIDWRINAAIWVALPAIAPEYIPVVDGAIRYVS